MSDTRITSCLSKLTHQRQADQVSQQIMDASNYFGNQGWFAL
jgi:hypothetical protein